MTRSLIMTDKEFEQTIQEIEVVYLEDLRGQPQPTWGLPSPPKVYVCETCGADQGDRYPEYCECGARLAWF